MKLPKRLSRVERCKPSIESITSLRCIARRNLRDARLEALSMDNRYRLAYEAAFALASMIVQANGFCPQGDSGHRTVFSLLKLVVGTEMDGYADFFGKCRRRRNRLTYIESRVVSSDELHGILDKVTEFSEIARRWMKKHHRQFV